MVFERAVRAAIIRRECLTYDTRYAAALPGRRDRVGHVFLVVRGRVGPFLGGARSAPVALVLADEELERVRPASLTFRTDGRQVDIVHLRLQLDELRVPVGLVHGPRELLPRCWDAAQRMLEDPGELTSLLDALATAGVTGGTVRVEADEPLRFRRLWAAIEPLFATNRGAASLKQLAAHLGLSTGQVGRDAKEFATTFGIGRGYRDLLLVMRLRSAVLLLSAPGATVAEIATAVGYGSTIALGRAFRDAKLPSPGAVQAALVSSDLITRD